MSSCEESSSDEGRWGGIHTSIEVDGFVMSPDGRKRPLKEEETWQFI
jgi:hypothetical protein